VCTIGPRDIGKPLFKFLNIFIYKKKRVCVVFEVCESLFYLSLSPDLIRFLTLIRYRYAFLTPLINGIVSATGYWYRYQLICASQGCGSGSGLDSDPGARK
jgi:hypothetical protein